MGKLAIIGGSLCFWYERIKDSSNSYNKEGRKNNVYADTRPVRVDVFETRDADSHHRLRFVRENLRVGENEGTFQRLAADSQEHIKPTVGLNVAKNRKLFGRSVDVLGFRRLGAFETDLVEIL